MPEVGWNLGIAISVFLANHNVREDSFQLGDGSAMKFRALHEECDVILSLCHTCLKIVYLIGIEVAQRVSKRMWNELTDVVLDFIPIESIRAWRSSLGKGVEKP